MQNSKNKITIEGIREIKVNHLKNWFKKQGVNEADLWKVLKNYLETISKRLRLALTDLFGEDVDIKKAWIEYVDYPTTETAYIKAILKGTEEELRNVAGVNKYFKYDWNKE
jgi:hypothetical protein